MRIIQLEVEDKNFEIFLTIIQNLKNGIIKNFKIDEEINKSIEFVLNTEQEKKIDKIAQNIANAYQEMQEAKRNEIKLQNAWELLDEL